MSCACSNGHTARWRHGLQSLAAQGNAHITVQIVITMAALELIREWIRYWHQRQAAAFYPDYAAPDFTYQATDRQGSADHVTMHST